MPAVYAYASSSTNEFSLRGVRYAAQQSHSDGHGIAVPLVATRRAVREACMDIIIPVAETQGVTLAIETHLGHLSDSIEAADRCL